MNRADVLEWTAARQHFEEFGTYTKLLPGSVAWIRFWEEERKRCREGYHTGRDYIPGYFYDYLNYSPILKSQEINKEIVIADTIGQVQAERVEGFPDFWDGDYDFFGYLDEAEKSGEHAFMGGSRGKGKEMPNYQPVKTLTGEVKLGDLRVGDKILGKDGKETTVLEIFPQGIKDIYELTFSDNRKVECGLHHLWSVIDKNGKYKILTTEKILENYKYKHKKTGYTYKYAIPTNDLIEYEEKILPIDPYILGCLIGDGSLTKQTPKISTTDNEIVQEFINRLPDYNIKRDIHSSNYTITYKKRFDKIETVKYENGKYGVNPLYREIVKLNLNKTCYTKFIPNIYKLSSKEQRLELVRGLLDTDGSISKNGEIEFSNSSIQLIDDLADVLRSLGINCKKFIKEKSDSRLYIYTNQEVFKLTRKKEKINPLKGWNKISIINIEKKGSTEQTCIMVDNDDKLFLTKDFIVTHNSFKAGSMLCRNYYHIEKSKSYAFAYSLEFLTGDGIITKAWDIMDFRDTYTPWGKRRQYKNTDLHRRSSYQETDSAGLKVEKGWKSEIIGVTVGDDIDKLRGKRGKLIILEEAGNFRKLHKGWNILRPSMEDGKSTFGLILGIGTGGCVCAGTKVWDNNGNLINIEDLKQENGILGYDGEKISKESIPWLQPPTSKQCYKLTTNTGRTLECSEDHPILYVSSWKKTGYTTSFIETNKLKINNKIAVIEQVNLFGSNKMWEPRLIGWLIGDGTYGKNQTVRLSNCESEINAYLINNLDTKVNVEYITKTGKIYQERRIKNIRPKLKELGILNQTKLNKKLPTNIHSYTKSDICELIGGLFDTDGYISYRENKKRNTKLVEISISQASKDLLKEIQLLLQKIGIHGVIRERKPRINNPIDKNSWYEFTICDGKSLLNFYNNITLIVKEKQERLNKIPEIYLNKKRGVKADKGIRFETIISIEDIGVKPIYNLEAGITHTYIANGIITHNTEGAASEGFEELFRNPKAYKIYPVTNKWEVGRENTNIAFFWSGAVNYTGAYDKETGVSNIELATQYIMDDRKLVATGADPHALTRRKAEIPLTPSEMLMRISGTQFPIGLLKEQEAEVFTKPHLYKDLDYYVKFVLDTETQKFKAVNDLEATPLLKAGQQDNKNMPGAFIIYEHPVEGSPIGRYVAGIDSYDFDESTTNSLGSMFIADLFTQRIVAEYTGRPDAHTFYETCRRGLLYYCNAQANIENANKGIFDYFDSKNCGYLIADTLNIVSEYNESIKARTGTTRKRGLTPNDKINAYARGMIAQYLKTSTNNPDKPEELFVHKFRCLPAIQEMINWNPDGNFDRVSALGCLILIMNDRLKYPIEERFQVEELDEFFTRNFKPKQGFSYTQTGLVIPNWLTGT